MHQSVIFSLGNIICRTRRNYRCYFCRMVIIIVRKQLHKIVPESIDIIVTPTISLLVIGLATIFLIMPVAGAISNGLVGIINVVLEKGGMVAGFTLGLTFLPMVMFGLHQILTPIHIEMINQTGMTLLLPILAMVVRDKSVQL